jgi:hypothetical protein
MDPDAGHGVAMAAGAKRSDLTFDDVRMPCEAEIVVAADLDVAGAGRAALQRMTALPEVDFPTHMVIVDSTAKKFRFLRRLDRDFFLERLSICNSKQHRTPLLFNGFLTKKNNG